MRYQLVFTSRAKKDLNRLPASLLDRFTKAFEQIARDPYCGKALKGELHNLFSYRMGDYRIIYQIEKNKVTVIVLKIGHRKDVYK
ncbi:MAG: hypothetical protein A3D10_04190 [Omnitrophica WOR_2 bacterium RIFCSPHIGHO2_02_FULL_48_11]|nr:MAG: hypothetical protein A3D10_04190 [Omnitrophica WOR_2 bacterium RIFCSPHIGHO2_02_FULL_48_11]